MTEEMYNGIVREEEKRATRKRKVARKHRVAPPKIEEDDMESDASIQDCIMVTTWPDQAKLMSMYNLLSRIIPWPGSTW
jgi:hypothetical protein